MEMVLCGDGIMWRWYYGCVSENWTIGRLASLLLSLMLIRGAGIKGRAINRFKLDGR